MKVEELTSYELIEWRTIADLNSESYLLRHKKTGARVALLSNDDDNKVFYVGFRTTPVNSTGVAHILEHSVLCGSKNFPVKDPFVELVKGSLNTFLNAMTYPDKTLYPVASCNDKDFQNLMHVYLDAVFYPNIYKEEKIFMQEGWHYELSGREEPLTLNGVVYNEMKGAFSSPDEVLTRELSNSLYPDTTYSFESGGDPQDIPKLSYEEFLNFHRSYYHPSNSYIYLYGDMDMAEKLDYIDREYLSRFEERQVDSHVQSQPAFAALNRVEKEYPIGDEEDEKGNAYFAYSMSVGDTLDKELYVAFQILDYALCSAPGAPLKQALTDAGIGTDIYSIYDNGIKQPYFSIVSKNADAGQEEAFLQVIRRVLGEIAEKGFDKKALLAGLNYFEFEYREADFGRYPKGLMYGLRMLDSWLYDDNKPFIHVEANETFAALRKKVETGYFEGLVKKYLIENPHKSLVVLLPKKGLTEQREKALREQLAAYKEQLSEEEVQDIIAKTGALKAYQDTPDTEENLAKIPMLTVGDIKKEAAVFVNELQTINGTDFLFHELFTNGIGYLRLMFKLDKVPERLFPYLGILKGTLMLLNTEHYAYAELFNEANIKTGGISADTNIYSSIRDEQKHTLTMELKTKVLYENLEAAADLMREIIMTSDFSDKKRIKEILAEGKSRMQGQMTAAGHSVAMMRAISGVSKTAAYYELLSGIAFYRLVEGLSADFEAKAADLSANLKELAEIIFRPENLMVDFTGSREAAGRLPAIIEKLKASLYQNDVKEGRFTVSLHKVKEGYKTPGQVQYVCRAGNFKQKGLAYDGSLRVLKVMMGYDYLWNQVRVKGGAYGCMCGFGKQGDSYFVSYRDPNLQNTIEIYEKAADYIASFEADERVMTQFIIGAVSELDTPMNPAAKGAFSLGGYMADMTDADLQKERDELLGTTPDKLKETAGYIRAFMADDCLCVVGNAEKISEAKELFEKVENLVG